MNRTFGVAAGCVLLGSLLTGGGVGAANADSNCRPELDFLQYTSKSYRNKPLIGFHVEGCNGDQKKGLILTGEAECSTRSGPKVVYRHSSSNGEALPKEYLTGCDGRTFRAYAIMSGMFVVNKTNQWQWREGTRPA